MILALNFLLYICAFGGFSTKTKTFVHKSQVCVNTYFIDTEWRLSLKSDSTFLYRIAEYNVLKRELGMPSDTMIYRGFYSISKDTVTLRDISSKVTCTKEARYYLKNNKLYALNNCLDTLNERTFLFLTKK